MPTKNLKPTNSRYRSRLGVAATAALAMLTVGLACQARAAEETKDARGDRTPASQSKEDYRYAGRTFDDWSRQLLNDLDPKTCAAAMDPIVAFGRVGYSDEAISALGTLLRSDRFTQNTDFLVRQAADTLAKIGPAAVPELKRGLADPRRVVRHACATSLGELGDGARVAKEPLVKLLDDDEQGVQIAALRSLIRLAGGDEDLQPTLKRFALSNNRGVRQAIADSLSSHSRKGDWWVSLCVQLANDEFDRVRLGAGHLLAERGPATKEVVAAVEQLICDADRNVSQTVLGCMTQGGNTALLIEVLNDGVESSDLWLHLHQQGLFPRAITVVGRVPVHAARSVPLLARIAAMKAPSSDQNDVLAAIDALGTLGTAAEEAIPVLERLTVGTADGGDVEAYKNHAWRALKKIRGE